MDELPILRHFASAIGTSGHVAFGVANIRRARAWLAAALPISTLRRWDERVHLAIVDMSV